MKSKISIITVSYNAIETIEKTMNSVFCQDYDNIEYIIIDGGSTDGTKEIILKYSDRLAYWISERDKGIYDAMNKGIQVATGDWITFRNCGDYFLTPTSLRDFFRIPISENISVVHGKCFWVNDWGYYEKEPEILHRPYDRGVMPVIHPATFVRSSVQKKYLFDLQYKSSADYDLFCRLLNDNYRFEYRPITIVSFNVVGFSTVNWDLSYFENCRIIKKYDKLFGSFFIYLGFLKLKLKYSIINTVNNNSITKKWSQRRMMKRGWHLLPVKMD